MDKGALQAHLSMGFPRQENRSGLAFPSLEDLPNPGTDPHSCIGRRILYYWATREVHGGLHWLIYRYWTSFVYLIDCSGHCVKFISYIAGLDLLIFCWEFLYLNLWEILVYSSPSLFSTVFWLCFRLLSFPYQSDSSKINVHIFPPF